MTEKNLKRLIQNSLDDMLKKKYLENNKGDEM